MTMFEKDTARGALAITLIAPPYCEGRERTGAKERELISIRGGSAEGGGTHITGSERLHQRHIVDGNVAATHKDTSTLLQTIYKV